MPGMEGNPESVRVDWLFCDSTEHQFTEALKYAGQLLSNLVDPQAGDLSLDHVTRIERLLVRNLEKLRRASAHRQDASNSFANR